MKLSIVIPVYNSSKILEVLVKKIKFHLREKLIYNYEIIFINDCSFDNSWSSIVYLSNKYNFIKGINLKNNIGQHGAIFVGLSFAIGKKIVTMDDDLQHSPSNIIKIYNKLNNYDLCYTNYLIRKHGFWKVFFSNINHYFSSLIFYKPFKIYLSSFRGFTSDIKNKIIDEKPNVVFLDSLLLKYSKKITTIKIIHKKRFEGNSNYNIIKLFSLWFDMIENFHFSPIRFGSIIGTLAFLIVKIINIFKKDKFLNIAIESKTF